MSAIAAVIQKMELVDDRKQDHCAEAAICCRTPAAVSTGKLAEAL